MLVSAPLEYINTNYTLLASSSARSVKGTESRNDRNMKADLEEDDASHKKKLYKNLMYNEFTFTYSSWYINPYHAKGYSWLVSTSAKHDYSCDWSKCSSTLSRTIVLYWVFGSKIDSRGCYPLFIILYIFLRWGHSFLVYVVPVLCHTAKKMKTWSWANKNSSLNSIFKGWDNFDC